MHHLQIVMFGSMRLTQVEQAKETQLSQSLQTLLAYLLIHRHRTHSREILADLLWGESDPGRARKCLNTTLWRLRKAIEDTACLPAETYLITTQQGELGFNFQPDTWLDTADFEQRVRPALAKPFSSATSEEINALDDGICLYQGDLLEGFYQDWVLQERERLRNLYLDSLWYLMRCYQQRSQPENSIPYGFQLLRLEPLREDVHRVMMRLYCETGQRALAVRQYEQCCAILNTELGIAPMPETQALYHQIMQDAPETAGEASHNTSGDLHLALQHLERVTQRFERAQEDLQRATQIVKHLAQIEEPA
jgi:DNA-binding SARP family transcriptional activator